MVLSRQTRDGARITTGQGVCPSESNNRKEPNLPDNNFSTYSVIVQHDFLLESKVERRKRKDNLSALETPAIRCMSIKILLHRQLLTNPTISNQSKGAKSGPQMSVSRILQHS